MIEGLFPPRLAETLYTAADAHRELGIPAGTVRSWASMGRIFSAGIDGHGRPMYNGADLMKARLGLIDLTRP